MPRGYGLRFHRAATIEITRPEFGQQWN